MSESPVINCKKEGCNVDKEGKSFEGHTVPEDCPNYVTDKQSLESESRKESTLETEQPGQPTMVELPEGTELNFGSANSITGASLTRFIICAGEVGSGKTTLLATLYEKLQEGPLADYLFCGSQTLIGFEKRCYFARIASGREKPETERTKPGFEKVLLHLKLRFKDFNRPAQDLLFTDISGETFNSIRDSKEECLRLGIIRRADHFVLFLDGEKLSQLDRRQQALKEGDTLLRNCIETEMLGKHSFVEVLIAKYDLLAELGTKETDKFVGHVKETLKRKYEKSLGLLQFFSVAARPKQGVDLPYAYGIENIFPVWIEKTPFFTLTESYMPLDTNLEREFDKYILKQS